MFFLLRVYLAFPTLKGKLYFNSIISPNTYLIIIIGSISEACIAWIILLSNHSGGRGSDPHFTDEETEAQRD